jgi:hypothetical protein
LRHVINQASFQEVVVGHISSPRTRRHGNRAVRNLARLVLETLEDRMVPTGPGPTGFGYVANSVPFQNVELSGDPSAFTIIQAADDAYAPVDLGSNTVNLYGITYTGNNQLFVSSNGLITFGSGNASRMNTDLTSGPLQPSVAVFWTDLTKSSGSPMILGEFKDTNGDGMPDELIIEWNQVFRFGVINAAPVTFEAIFQINNDSQTSSITFNYTSTITGDPASDNGADATVGIKGANAQTTDPSADRLLVSFKSTSPFVGSGKSIQFTAPPFGNTLSGQVFNDFNRNGVKDAGEPGLASFRMSPPAVTRSLPKPSRAGRSPSRPARLQRPTPVPTPSATALTSAPSRASI